MEIWKDIKGYEGQYQISNLGQVKSLQRTIIRTSSPMFISEKILKQGKDAYGYWHVCLFKNGEGHTIKIHKLLAIAFLNHKPLGFKIVVDHIDNNKDNNYLTNLQLISNRENTSKDKKGCSSKYVGVHLHKASKKWMASIRINGRKRYLGTFDNELKASEAYNNKLTQINKLK